MSVELMYHSWCNSTIRQSLLSSVLLPVLEMHASWIEQQVERPWKAIHSVMASTTPRVAKRSIDGNASAGLLDIHPEHITTYATMLGM